MSEPDKSKQSFLHREKLVPIGAVLCVLLVLLIGYHLNEKARVEQIERYRNSPELIDITLPLMSLEPEDVESGGVQKWADVGVLSLRVDVSELSDEGWKQLQGLDNLWRLDLNNMKNVGDTEVEKISNLTQLRELDLGMTYVSDKGMKHLVKLKNLTKLYLYGDSITDAGLPHIGELTELQILFLDGFITDEGMQHLKGLTKLETVRLEVSYVSDAGLKHLHGLKNLQLLGLEDWDVWNAVAKENEITEEGVNDLKQALPNCRVDWQRH